MESLAGLTRQLKTVSSLANLVKTLKVLSAVNIRLFSKACEALDAYQQNIEGGLQVALRELPRHPLLTPTGQTPRTVIFGSDHGLCGAFHQQLLHFACSQKLETGLICIGTRLADAAEDLGLKVDSVLSAPTSTAALGVVAGELMQKLQPSQGNVSLLYQHNHNSSYEPRLEVLLPVQENWLTELRRRRWSASSDRHGLPFCWGDPSQAIGWLLEEHILVACQRALSHSLASENQARLLTMQAAEKNLGEMQVGLQETLQSRRQNAVTEELLDVISGFEMLKDAQI